MKVLVINSGSSSVKYQLINMNDEKVMAKGLCERIGVGGSFIKHKKTGQSTIVIDKDMYNHKIALEEVLAILTDKENGVIKDMSEIIAVGHRVVHGGECFSDSVLIDEKVMKAIEECIELAPLHNPPNITGIEACKEIMPDVPMVAVFDTAFHQTMPRHSYMYAIPYELYKKYAIRKYGFHGTSHKYVANRAAALLKRPIGELKIITCHLGNGASICAVKNGNSIDTSMGFTPLAGLVMGTRSGDIDPAIVTYLIEKENKTAREINKILNKKSGILGLTGRSSDFRDILNAAKNGDERAKYALDIFNYRVKKYIGKYAAAMGGVDALVFTAGVGENNCGMRSNMVKGLDFLGIKIDEEKNLVRGEEKDISADDAKVKTLIIPTNEELAIARECKRILG